MITYQLPDGITPNTEQTGVVLNDGAAAGEFKRPNEITVSLYQDGNKVEGKDIKLNEENNWSYTWSELEENHTYSVKEEDPSDDYTVSYSEESIASGVITITNKKKPTSTPTPTSSSSPTPESTPTPTPSTTPQITPTPSTTPSTTPTPSNENAVDTSDHSDMLVWMCVASVAMINGIFLTFIRKRNS